MIFIPTELPTSTNSNFLNAFNRANAPQSAISKAQLINTRRVDFYNKFNFLISAKKRLQTEETLQQMKAYLYETYNIMSLLNKHGAYSMNPVYISALSTKVKNFEMPQNAEICSTAEIIFSRYTYCFGILAMLGEVYEEINQIGTGNGGARDEPLLQRIELILKHLEDGSVRLAKLWYIRDVLWVGLENLPGNYHCVLELNYSLVEAFYL